MDIGPYFPVLVLSSVHRGTVMGSSPTQGTLQYMKKYSYFHKSILNCSSSSRRRRRRRRRGRGAHDDYDDGEGELMNTVCTLSS
jgi:hypothetical protein